MWLGVEPEEMCDNHLLGEHKELHMEVGCLKNHPHGQAIVEGHVSEGQVVLSQIGQRHKKLVLEMLERGMNHESPISIESLPENELYDVNKTDEQYNRSDLDERCEDCLN
jgi:hypothetical protein